MSRVVALAVALPLLLLAAAPASASPETLKRAVSNALFGPADIALSPVMGPWTVYNGLRYQDDSPGVRWFYTVPGVIWNFGVQAAAGCLRTVAGLLELGPGLGLFFFETDLDPIYAPAERADAWVDRDTPVLYVKLGLDYVAPASF